MTTSVKYATSVKVLTLLDTSDFFQSLSRSCVRPSGVLLSINRGEDRPCYILKKRSKSESGCNQKF